MSVKYLVAIPVFNEEQRIADVLRTATACADNILVIDDGSTDASAFQIERVGGIRVIRHRVNLGYGRSLAKAFEYACRHRYDWLITMDGDGQHEPAAIPDFVETITTADADIISGSRYLRSFAGEGAAPAERRLINLKITDMLNARLGLSITDAFCGFKAYRVAMLSRLHITESGYAMPMQVWAQAAGRGLRIVELPVRLVYNDPHRRFGGELDDATVRYRHYVNVFEAQMRALEAGFDMDDSVLRRAGHSGRRAPCIVLPVAECISS